MKDQAEHSLFWIAHAMVLSFVFLSAPAHSADTRQSQSQSQSSSGTHKGVMAVVATDGALVYASPSEDATIITQLPVGKRIRVSKGTTPGIQKFHKVLIGKKVGYIDDIDISIGVAGATTPTASSPKREDPDHPAKKKVAHKRKEPKPKEPMYFTRWVGLAVGSSEFKENITGVNSITSFPVYGLKLTGPDILLGGPVMELNIMLHYGAPSYYSVLSSIPPSGFVLFTDAMFIVPFIQKQNAMFYVSAGPLLVYSKFGVVNAGREMDLQALELGVDGALGGGFRVGNVAVRLEGKYFQEKQSYKAIIGAIQTGF